MNKDSGVDILHIAHHGSESSTSAEYYNLMKPEVAVISVGKNQGCFLHSRVDVVDKVRMGPDRPACVEAPPVECVFQNNDCVKGDSATGSTSFSGLVLGNIYISTDGKNGYEIYVDSQVDETSKAELDRPTALCDTHFKTGGGKGKPL